eukprot:COSAG01_NODE_35415_length_532_cov_0.829099_2_plen_26_part_01
MLIWGVSWQKNARAVVSWRAGVGCMF